MIYLKWICLALLSIVMTLAGVLLVPVALCLSGGGRLPWYFEWYDNDREPYGDTARRPAIDAATGLKRAWLRWWWLAIRNPANNFGYLPWVGFAQTADTQYVQSGNPLTSDQGETGYKATTAWRHAPYGPCVAWEYYLVAQWSATRCLRVRLGWKIDQNMSPQWRNTAGEIAQLVVVINPVDGFGA